jgi:glycosyltransferase involved in cell wall biosynthesis
LKEEQIRTMQDLAGVQLARGRNRYFLSPSSRFFLCWQDGLLPWLESWDPAALVLEANPRYMSSRRAIRWMHDRGRPVLGWGLGAPPVSGVMGSLQQANRRAFLSQLDGVIAYSQRGAAEYRQAGIPAERVYVAPNSAAPRPAASLPERSGLSSGPGRVLFVGRLQERKRLDVLFAAARLLPAELRPEIIVVGEGPARAGFEAAAVGLKPAVRFVGEQHGEALAAQFRQAELFVLPGTGGLAVQQALANGLPIIVAQGDGSQDDMVHPANGWQVVPGDVPALAAALREALSDRQRLLAMGRESYRIAVEEINLEQMAAGFVGALQTVLKLGLRSSGK